MLRDAKSLPPLATGRTLGLAFGGDGRHLVALTNTDGVRGLSVWDVTTQSRSTPDHLLCAADESERERERERERDTTPTHDGAATATGADPIETHRRS